jgi:hypoxanthine phosphoribosyltransferase
MENMLYTEETIQEAVHKIARQITEDYRGQDILLVCILKGSIIFTADLAREIERIAEAEGGVRTCRIDFMRTSAYGDSTTPGDVRIILDLDRSVRGENVILIEDVADTLHTLARLQAHIRAKQPASLKTAVLLTKPHNHERDDVPLDYVGIVGTGAGFVIGYGMDDAGTKRGLPFIVEKQV